MQFARFLYTTGRSTKSNRLTTSIHPNQASVSRCWSQHNRAFHRHSQNESSTKSSAIAHPSPTTLNLRSQQGIYRQTLQDQTPRSLRQASNTTQTAMPQEPTIHSSYETKTGTWQYVVADPSTKTAVIIDAVLDYDPSSQVISTDTADALLSFIFQKGYKIERILETHAHADHLTAASYLQGRLALQQGHRPPICIGKRITQVQDLFGQRYGVPIEEYRGIFDKLLDDNESFEIGNLTATVTHLPGHTPDHVGYIIGENVFCGDSLFHTDIGTARADFPGGNAKDLYKSGRKLLELPDHFKIWTGHDYPPDERGAPVPCLSVRDHKERNKHLANGTTQEMFVSMREERDATRAAPKLLHPSLQINIRAGRLPGPTPLGHQFLHLPLQLKGMEW